MADGTQVQAVKTLEYQQKYFINLIFGKADRLRNDYA